MTKLDEALERGQITRAQANAGHSFAIDAEAASGDGLRHADMRRVRATPSGYVMPAGSAQRYRDALRALGPLGEIATLVCVQDRPASDWSDARSEPRHSAMPTLRLALDCLARFYGIQVAT